MLLQNSNKLRYSARKPLKMLRKERYKCICQKTEDSAQMKCRKRAGNGLEIFKNEKENSVIFFSYPHVC